MRISECVVAAEINKLPKPLPRWLANRLVPPRPEYEIFPHPPLNDFAPNLKPSAEQCDVSAILWARGQSPAELAQLRLPEDVFGLIDDMLLDWEDIESEGDWGNLTEAIVLKTLYARVYTYNHRLRTRRNNGSMAKLDTKEEWWQEKLESIAQERAEMVKALPAGMTHFRALLDPGNLSSKVYVILVNEVRDFCRVSDITAAGRFQGGDEWIEYASKHAEALRRMNEAIIAHRTRDRTDEPDQGDDCAQLPSSMSAVTMSSSQSAQLHTPPSDMPDTATLAPSDSTLSAHQGVMSAIKEEEDTTGQHGAD